MRDAGKRWENFSHIQAACGVKIVAPNLEKAIAGTTLHLANTAEQKSNAEQMIREEWRGIYDKMPIMCSVCKKYHQEWNSLSIVRMVVVKAPLRKRMV